MNAFFERARAVHVLRLGLDGTIEACNAATADALGVPRQQLLGEPVGRFLTEPDAGRLRAELSTSGRRGDSLLLNFVDVHQVPYTLDCLLDVDEGGATLVGEPPLKQDQRMQRGLLAVNEDLALLAREQTRLVEAERRAKREAEFTNREKDRAVATIAHELRQPLGPMRMALDLLTREHPDVARSRACGVIERQLAQLSRLVEDLLDSARIRERKLQLTRTDVDLRGLLGEIADDARGKMAAAGVSLECALVPDPVPIHADAARVRQVFSNLLDNALKYTGSGGRVSLTLARDGTTAVATVRDTGRGIAPELLPRIFELFAQARAGEGGGLGIGLAVAAGIVHLHGGTMEAESAGLNQGASFVVRLPLTGVAAAQPAASFAPVSD